MIPNNLHFIKSNTTYLGKFSPIKSQAICFVKHTHASFVQNYINEKDKTITLTQSKKNTYLLHHSRLTTRTKTKIESLHMDTALFFCNVNNIQPVVIDEVLRKPNGLILNSNFSLDHLQLYDTDIIDQFDRLYELSDDEEIDYEYEYANILLNTLIQEGEFEE